MEKRKNNLRIGGYPVTMVHKSERMRKTEISLAPLTYPQYGKKNFVYYVRQQFIAYKGNNQLGQKHID